MPVALGPSELSTLLIVLCVVVVPIAAFAFARSGKGYDELGKGTFSIDREAPPPPGSAPPELDPDEHEAEVRQMVEASAYRRSRRGDEDLDIQAEIDRVLGRGHESDSEDGEPDPEPAQAPATPDGDPIREEIRQLVIANNERRERRGEDPLDVDSEVDRRLREWG
ncbi:MAG TPA: hypothetical protein VMF31_07475 [Solirubrobacterales bacterium]|nr:hypothetical protein [Solirubrobacterales bacterium]